jgi:hypothetical protein
MKSSHHMSVQVAGKGSGNFGARPTGARSRNPPRADMIGHPAVAVAEWWFHFHRNQDRG